jgi:HEAT repeat protein
VFIRVHPWLLFVLLIFVASAARAQEVPTVTAAEVERAVDQGLASEDEIVAMQAEELLLRAVPGALPDLVAALAKKGAARRRRAAEVLGRLGDPRAVRPLAAALADRDLRGDEALRLEVARALCRLGSTDGIGALIELLESGDKRTRLDALVVLRRYTHHRFSFEHDGTAAARASGVKEWQRWWAESGASFRIVEPLGR